MSHSPFCCPLIWGGYNVLHHIISRHIHHVTYITSCHIHDTGHIHIWLYNSSFPELFSITSLGKLILCSSQPFVLSTVESDSPAVLGWPWCPASPPACSQAPTLSPEDSVCSWAASCLGGHSPSLFGQSVGASEASSRFPSVGDLL